MVLEIAALGEHVTVNEAPYCALDRKPVHVILSDV